MATQEITTKERVEFSSVKVFSAMKWVILSGTATFGLNELLKLVTQLDLPAWALLLSGAIINTLIFGVAKFIEGSDKE
jgi:hypothetical protein